MIHRDPETYDWRTTGDEFFEGKKFSFPIIDDKLKIFKNEIYPYRYRKILEPIDPDRFQILELINKPTFTFPEKENNP